jgi:hypothetical protein
MEWQMSGGESGLPPRRDRGPVVTEKEEIEHAIRDEAEEVGEELADRADASKEDDMARERAGPR